MSKKKEIDSCYLAKESIIDIVLSILSSNNSYADFLQSTAERLENQVAVITDE